MLFFCVNKSLTLTILVEIKYIKNRSLLVFKLYNHVQNEEA